MSITGLAREARNARAPDVMDRGRRGRQRGGELVADAFELRRPRGIVRDDLHRTLPDRPRGRPWLRGLEKRRQPHRIQRGRQGVREIEPERVAFPSDFVHRHSLLRVERPIFELPVEHRDELVARAAFVDEHVLDLTQVDESMNPRPELLPDLTNQGFGRRLARLDLPTQRAEEGLALDPVEPLRDQDARPVAEDADGDVADGQGGHPRPRRSLKDGGQQEIAVRGSVQAAGNHPTGLPVMMGG